MQAISEYYEMDLSEGTLKDRFLGSSRVFLLSAKAWGDIVSELNREYPSNYAAVLKGMGALYGKSAARAAKRSGRTGNKAIGELLSLASASGWGKFWMEKQSTGLKISFNIGVRNCVFCSSRSTSAKASCHFLEGIVEGAFSESFSTKMRCKEISCIAKGDDHCSFLVS